MDSPSVLFVITRMVRGGAQGTMLRTAAGLAGRGWRVGVLSGPETGPEGSYLEEAAGAGIPVRILPDLLREVRPLRDLRALAGIRAAIRDFAPDLVHTYTSKAGTLGRIAARTTGVPVIHSPQGHIYAAGGKIPSVSDRPGMRRLFLAVERALAGWTDRTVALARDDAAELERLGLARGDRIRRIPNPIDDAAFHPADPKAFRAEVGLNGGPVLGIVGRLAAEKGHRFLLDVFREVLGTHPSARLLVVGDGPERPAIERAVVETGLADRIHLIGLMRDVRPALAAMDLFLLTSSYEGQGIVLVEAMAAGVPVVATAVGGVPDVVEDGVTGRLVRYGDVSGAADAVRGLLADAETRRRMADAGRRRARDFGLAAAVDRLEALYREAIGSGHGRV